MPTIDEIRQKYPQYGDMSDAALADAMHNKFYADMPKEEFQQKIGLPVTPPAGKLERLGTGFMDPIYGAAQIGARMTEPGEEMGAAIAGQDVDHSGRIAAVDQMVKEREQQIQSRRPASQRDSTDWLRVGGSIPSTAALSPPVLGLPGAVVSGAVGGALQPTTDTENFGTEKLKGAGVGAAGGAVLGAAGKALGAGVRGFGSYLAREYPENVMTQAVQKILKRMGQDEKAGGGPTAQQALDLINEASAAGKPMTLADVGGENVRALAGNVARAPESRAAAQQFLTQRDEAAAQRLSADVARYVHGGQGMHQTTEALLEARSAAARPAYEVAMDPARIVDSPRLRGFLSDPTVRQGIPKGLESQRLEALAAGEPFNPNAAQALVMDEAGNITGIRGVPNMRTLDAVKRGLDAQIEGERDAVTGRLSQRGTMLNRVRAEFVNELDSLNPDYRAARAVWGGYSSSLDAMRAGRSAFRSAPDEIAAEIRGMTPANQEFYRLGVADAIRERLMKTGLSGDEAKAIIKNPWMRDQLKPIFRSPQDFEAFVNSVTAEGRMFATKQKVLGGSQTAERLAEDTSGENAMAAHGMHLAEQAGTGKWLSAVKTIVRMWRDRQDRAGNPRLNEQVARILFQTPIDETSEIGQRLTGQFTGPEGINRLSGAANVLENAPRVLTPGAGSALYQPTQ